MNIQQFITEIINRSECHLSVLEAKAVYHFSTKVLDELISSDEAILNGYDHIISEVSRRKASTFQEVYAIVDEIWGDYIKSLAYPTFESYIEESGKEYIQFWVQTIIESVNMIK